MSVISNSSYFFIIVGILRCRTAQQTCFCRQRQSQPCCPRFMRFTWISSV